MLAVRRCDGVREDQPAAAHLHNEVLFKLSAQSSPPCQFAVALQSVLPHRKLVRSLYCPVEFGPNELCFPSARSPALLTPALPALLAAQARS